MALDLFLVRIRGYQGVYIDQLDVLGPQDIPQNQSQPLKHVLGKKSSVGTIQGPKKTAQNSSRASKHEQFSFLIFRETLTGHNLVIRTPIYENSDSISRIFPRRTQWHSPFPLIQNIKFNSALIYVITSYLTYGVLHSPLLKGFRPRNL